MTMSPGPMDGARTTPHVDDPSHLTDASPPPTTAHSHFETPPSSPGLDHQPGPPENPAPSSASPDASRLYAPYNLDATTSTDNDVPRSSTVPSASPASSRPILSDLKPLDNDTHHGDDGSLVTHLDKDGNTRQKAKRRRLHIWLAIGLLAVIIVVLAIVLPIVLTGHGPSGSSAIPGHGGHGHGGDPANPESPTGAITGGDGTVVVMSDGTSFTYTNKFGGFCTSPINSSFGF